MSRAICIIAHRLLFVAVRRLVIFILLMLRRIGDDSSRYWSYTLNEFPTFRNDDLKAEMAQKPFNIAILYRPVSTACYFHLINYQTVRIPRMILLMNGFDVRSSWSSGFIGFIRGTCYLRYGVCIEWRERVSHFRMCSEFFKVLSLKRYVWYIINFIFED